APSDPDRRDPVRRTRDTARQRYVGPCAVCEKPVRTLQIVPPNGVGPTRASVFGVRLRLVGDGRGLDRRAGSPGRRDAVPAGGGRRRTAGGDPLPGARPVPGPRRHAGVARASAAGNGTHPPNSGALCARGTSLARRPRVRSPAGGPGAGAPGPPRERAEIGRAPV